MKSLFSKDKKRTIYFNLLVYSLQVGGKFQNDPNICVLNPKQTLVAR